MQRAKETGIQMQWYCWKTTGEENWHVNYGWDRWGETRAKEGWRRRNPRHHQYHHTWFNSNQSAVLFWYPPILWKRCCCHYSFVLSAKHEVGNLRARPPNRTGSLNPSPRWELEEGTIHLLCCFCFGAIPPTIDCPNVETRGSISLRSLREEKVGVFLESKRPMI